VTAETLTAAEAERLVRTTLARCDTGEAQAAAVARALAGAELVGQAGHGLRRLPAYAAQALSGKVDGHAEPAAAPVRPGALAVDAAHGFAYAALELAVAELPALARAQGIAMAGIRRSHHAGVTGLPAEALAGAGLVALLFANSPGAIAPWGGRRALFGTNPIAFAAPVPGEAPLVVDLSMSAVARGRVMAAAQQGEAIPEGWALDAEGRATTDGRAALAGTMAPLGGAKGAALALVVEVLSAALTGGSLAAEASSFLDAEGPPPGTGQLLIAIDPAALDPAAPERIGALAAAVAGEPGARLPGRRRQGLRAERLCEGIPVDPRLLREIEALGR
jgi:(2R)-3-sulfolactate dehydrogenase (NADP+)